MANHMGSHVGSHMGMRDAVAARTSTIAGA
jgi:hypothetical protein